jgi:hypothetical protein
MEKRITVTMFLFIVISVSGISNDVYNVLPIALVLEYILTFEYLRSRISIAEVRFVKHKIQLAARIGNKER